jgi:hypothetical protein
MTLLKNILFFFVVYLPALALASMFMQLIPAVVQRTPSEWELGWNPILWLITTAPWQIPNVVFVPVLHLLAGRAGRRHAPGTARRVVVPAAAAMFLLGNLALWRLDNMAELAVPVAVAGVVYGVVFRVPSRSSD